MNKCAPLVPSEQLSDYTVFDYYPFDLKESQKVTIEGGRGCPFSCSFCSTNRFWKNTFRIKPIESLIDEMKCFYDKYGIKCFDINHDLFTANREYIISFCSCLIQKNLNFNWYCSSRVDVLDFDLIDLMKKAGCKGIFFGIESGSVNIQKNIRKNLNLERAEQILVYCHNNGIKIVASFIYGLPEETISNFYDTINFIENLINADIDQIQLHKFIPFPGTDEYLKVKDRLYFDLLKCDFSIMYNKNIFSDEILLDIQQHVDLYPQFYVFNSEVNDRFTTIGEFMDYLTLMSPFKVCLKIVIKKYGLLNFYLLIKNQFDQMYDDFKKSNILNRVYDEKFIYKQFEFTYSILEVLKLEINSDIYDINLAYGAEIISFIKSDENRRIKKFTYDIEKMIKERKLIEKDCFILFNKNEKQIKIKQFQNIGSVLNEYRKEG